MPLTRDTLASKLVTQVGGYLTSAGLSVVTTSSNALLMDAALSAYRRLGLTPIDPMAISDTDLSNVPSAKVHLYTLYARLETLYLILTHVSGMDQQVGNHEIIKSTFANSIREAIKLLLKEISQIPGAFNSSGMSAGQMVTGTYPNDPRDLAGTISDPTVWPYP